MPPTYQLCFLQKSTVGVYIQDGEGFTKAAPHNSLHGTPENIDTDEYILHKTVNEKKATAKAALHEAVNSARALVDQLEAEGTRRDVEDTTIVLESLTDAVASVEEQKIHQVVEVGNPRLCSSETVPEEPRQACRIRCRVSTQIFMSASRQLHPILNLDRQILGHTRAAITSLREAIIANQARQGAGSESDLGSSLSCPRCQWGMGYRLHHYVSLNLSLSLSQIPSHEA